MKKSQGGFTLIELVVVIVLLGILGVTALGKFQDLSGDAASAATTAIAAELSASSTLNYAEGILDASYSVPLVADPVCTTALLDDLLLSVTWPTGYTVAETNAGTDSGDCSGGAGTTASCTLTHTASSSTAVASIVCGG